MKINRLLIILLSFCLSGCSTNNDKETILIIGRYKLTKAGLELKRNNNKYKFLTQQALEEKLIEEGRIIAFALDNRYDTLATLKKLFEYASSSYAAQVNGFVWNKKFKSKLELTENDIKNTYLKRSHEYLLDVLLFSDKNSLNRYYKSSENFNNIKTKSSPDSNVKFFNAGVKFPYYPLSYYTENLNNLKIGDIIGPVETERGYMLARVVTAKPIVKNPYEQEKSGIRQDLLFGLTQKYLWENQKRICKEANPEVYDTSIKHLALNFDTQKKNWPGVNTNMLIMKYNFDGKRISYLVSDFHEFVNNQPVFIGSLTTPEGVKKILRTIIIEKYLFAEAKRMNMKSDFDYQQFSKDNQENIFIEHYKKNYVYPRLSIYPKESEDYYRKNIRNFEGFGLAKIYLFKFKSIQSAFKGRTLLERKIKGSGPFIGNGNNGNISLPDAIEMEVKMNDPNNNSKLLGAILRLAPGQISAPLEVNGEFVIINLIAKQGLTTIPYSYVKDDIERLIRFEKEKQLVARLEERLKEKYPVEKDELKEYLSSIK